MKRSNIRPKPRRPKPGDDPGYREFLRTECGCCVCAKLPVNERPAFPGPIDPAHTGRNGGIGLKAPDRQCVPLCRVHHHERDSGKAGKFAFDEKWDLVREAEIHFAAYGTERKKMHREYCDCDDCSEWHKWINQCVSGEKI